MTRLPQNPVNYRRSMFALPSVKILLAFCLLSILLNSLASEAQVDHPAVAEAVAIAPADPDFDVGLFDRGARSSKQKFIRFGKRSGQKFIRFGRSPMDELAMDYAPQYELVPAIQAVPKRAPQQKFIRFG